jgi:hypothetical protein
MTDVEMDLEGLLIAIGPPGASTLQIRIVEINSENKPDPICHPILRLQTTLPPPSHPQLTGLAHDLAMASAWNWPVCGLNSGIINVVYMYSLLFLFFQWCTVGHILPPIGPWCPALRLLLVQ